MGKKQRGRGIRRACKGCGNFTRVVRAGLSEWGTFAQTLKRVREGPFSYLREQLSQRREQPVQRAGSGVWLARSGEQQGVSVAGKKKR